VRRKGKKFCAKMRKNMYGLEYGAIYATFVRQDAQKVKRPDAQLFVRRKAK
jgi:hypothetical protein